jgi:hypothetical protein
MPAQQQTVMTQHSAGMSCLHSQHAACLHTGNGSTHKAGSAALPTHQLVTRMSTNHPRPFSAAQPCQTHTGILAATALTLPAPC